MATARSIEVVINIYEKRWEKEHFVCCMTECAQDVAKNHAIGTIKIRVTEGDFPKTVRARAIDEFRKEFHPQHDFAFDLRSSRDHPVVNNYGANQRFITDGTVLFIHGMWAYEHLEPCTHMVAIVEYIGKK